MSLTTRLQLLKSWFDEVRQSSENVLTAEGAAEFSQQLGAALVEAEQLETDVALQLQHFGTAMRGVAGAMRAAGVVPEPPADNIVSFPRRPVRRPPVRSPDGGSAA